MKESGRCYPGKIVLSVIIGLVLLIGVAGRGAVVMTNADYVEGEVLVHFRDLRTANEAKAVAALHGCELTKHFAWLSQHVGHTIGLLHSPDRSTAALLAELATEPAVALAEPNYIRTISDLRTPNDADFGELWNLQNTGQSVFGFNGSAGADINFLPAWGMARPATNEVVVGVVDTGLDITHPDIVSNLWTNPGEIAGNGIDDDKNGYADDVHGYDFALGKGTLSDSGYHGTHVAGIIAATGNNKIGVIGVDFKAHIMVLKVSSDGSTLNSSAIVEAVGYAAMMKGRGVNVVALNGSYGGGSYSSSEASAIQAAGDANIVFCAAAGNSTNDNDTSPVYPASYRLNNMIVVAATDQSDQLANFSDYGATTVDLAAPGVNIFSLLPLSLNGDSASLRQSQNVYSAAPIQYAGSTPTNGFTARMYNCGLGNPSEFPAAVSNNIALIERGTLTFAAKVTNATTAGARAAVIYNNVTGNFSGTLGVTGNWIPAVSLSQTDGQKLAGLVPATATVLNAPDPTQSYQYLDGTSMATPHVSGAVAFAALNFPGETAVQRVQRILANTTPVPALAGVVATGGRLNLSAIVDTDGNGLPDWWELQYFGHLTGTDPAGDPDQDGEDNLAEFLAGTDPTDPSLVFHLITPVPLAGNRWRMEWPSVAGRYYRILRSTNLISGVNTVVQTNLAATPPFNIFTDTPPTSASATFYQLQLEP